MDFRILGPLEVVDNGREPVIAPGKQRALLGLLLLHANQVVSRDRLIEELWGEEPPASAANSLHVHVSRLRRALNGENGNGADNVVLTRGGGYLIRVAVGELDRECFEALVEQGAQELIDGSPARARATLEEALALWRGPPLADFAYESFAQPEIARLDELRLAALELRIEAELALGRTAQAIPELESLIAQHPFRERLRGLLMLALYRSGRQADALEAYQQARSALVDELGIEPGEPLRELERAILAQDSAIDAPPVVPEPAQPVRGAPRTVAPRRGHLRWAVVALGVLAAGAVAVALLRDGPDDGSVAPLTDDSHAVASIDPDTNDVTDVLSVGSRPGSLAYERATDSLWVANLDDKTVTHIDPQRLRVGKTVPIGGAPTDLAAGGGAVWVASHPRGTRVRLDKINARFDTRERTVRVGDLAGDVNRLALGGGALWVAPEWGLLTRVDARTGSVVRPAIDPKHHPTGIAAGGDAVWATGGQANTVTRIDARTGLATPIPVGNGPAEVALGGGSVWVALALDDALVRIDPETGAVQRTIPIGDSPAGVALGAGSVWVANSGDGTVSRIDRRTGKLVATIPVGASPQDVTVADGRVWVSVRPRALPEGTPGDAVRVEVAQGVDSMDPAFGWGINEYQLGYATGLKLLNYPDAPGPAGAQLQPEAAESFPTRSGDGRTYTFTIRTGFRFSPPSGQSVTAETFRYAIERALSPKMQADAGLFASDIVGAQRYMDGKADHIAGLRVRGNKLMIRLARAVGDFPARISMPMFAAVPTDTPIDPDLGKVASAGPYYVDSFAAREGMVLKRNPNYRGGRPHRFEEIRLVGGVQRVEATRHVEDGTADYAPGNEFVGALPDARRLANGYGPGSDAATAGEQRYFINPVLQLDHIVLNTSRPLFSSPRLRRAVNYAVDRRALAAQGGLELGLPSTPTDQYLPPGMPGFSDARIYPMRANVEKAKRLAGGRERTAVLYAYDRPPSPQVAQIVKTNLKAIGIDVEIKLFAKGVYFKRLGRRGEPYDMAIQGWFADYADPADFLSPLDGRALDPKSFLSGAFLNFAKFDDPAFNRRLLAAEKLSGPRRYAAYSRIEHDMVRDAAPWIAIGNEASPDFFSARIGCQVYHPVYGIDLAALCVRR